eukprot:2116776-Alexandrium_andersonii.AAC.1
MHSHTRARARMRLAQASSLSCRLPPGLPFQVTSSAIRPGSWSGVRWSGLCKRDLEVSGRLRLCLRRDLRGRASALAKGS